MESAADTVFRTPASPKLTEVFRSNAGKPWISLEFFPPKTPEGVEKLFEVMAELKKYNPVFMDVTWGAGGSTSDLTIEICKRIKSELSLNANMHLTCTNMETIKIDNALEECKASGLTNILALRGDPPAGQAAWVATEGGFSCALDLVTYIRTKFPDDFFNISVAGYPEGHPSKMTVVSDVDSLTSDEQARYSIDHDDAGNKVISVCRDTDFISEMAYLKAKIDAGATAIITQMFFDIKVFENFMVACKNVGIDVPIIPGIMLISTYAGFKRMVKFCKTRVPDELSKHMEAIKDDAEAVKAFGIEFGTKLCRGLIDLGVIGLHFYTLNTSKTTKAILANLNLDGFNGVTEDVEVSVASAV